MSCWTACLPEVRVHGLQPVTRADTSDTSKSETWVCLRRDFHGKISVYPVFMSSIIHIPSRSWLSWREHDDKSTDFVGSSHVFPILFRQSHGFQTCHGASVTQLLVLASTSSWKEGTKNIKEVKWLGYTGLYWVYDWFILVDIGLYLSILGLWLGYTWLTLIRKNTSLKFGIESEDRMGSVSQGWLNIETYLKPPTSPTKLSFL